MSHRVTVILLSGPIGAGKTALAEGLTHRYGGGHIHTSELIAASSKPAQGRRELQRTGQSAQFQQGEWLVRAVNEQIPASSHGPVVVDSVRTLEQVHACRHSLDGAYRIVHVHLMAQVAVLAERFAGRAKLGDAGLSWHQAMQAPQEATAGSLEQVADLVIDTSQLTPEDVAVRVEARISRHVRRPPNVDILVGGQWGSEGKGNIAYALAPEYDLLVRVGAPNAGHKVRVRDGAIYTHRQLPSGTQATSAPILLGPGAVLDARILLQEIADCHLSPDRLTIDPRALVIEDEDVRREAGLKTTIGSTGTGGGAAVARRIMGRAAPTLVRTAQDIPELSAYIGESADRLKSVGPDGSVLVEGTQGTSLSLLHGSFPHVTSRDTTVGTLLAEVGVPPQSVRHVM